MLVLLHVAGRRLLPAEDFGHGELVLRPLLELERIAWPRRFNLGRHSQVALVPQDIPSQKQHAAVQCHLRLVLPAPRPRDLAQGDALDEASPCAVVVRGGGPLEHQRTHEGRLAAPLPHDVLDEGQRHRLPLLVEHLPHRGEQPGRREVVRAMAMQLADQAAGAVDLRKERAIGEHPPRHRPKSAVLRVRGPLGGLLRRGLARLQVLLHLVELERCGKVPLALLDPVQHAHYLLSHHLAMVHGPDLVMRRDVPVSEDPVRLPQEREPQLEGQDVARLQASALGLLPQHAGDVGDHEAPDGHGQVHEVAQGQGAARAAAVGQGDLFDLQGVREVLAAYQGRGDVAAIRECGVHLRAVGTEPSFQRADHALLLVRGFAALARHLFDQPLQIILRQVGQALRAQGHELPQQVLAHFLVHAEPVAHVHCRPISLGGGRELDHRLGREWNDRVLEKARHLELAHVREQRQVHRGGEVDEPHCVQRVDHDVGSVQVAVREANERIQLLGRFRSHALETGLDRVDDELLQVGEIPAEVLLVQLAHGRFRWVLALLGGQRIVFALLPLERVPAPQQRMLRRASQPLAALPQRGDDAAGAEGLCQDAVDVAERPHVAGRRRGAQEDLFALVQQQVLEGGQKVRRALGELGHVPARARQLEAHRSKALARGVRRVLGVAQDAGGAVGERLEHVLRVHELLLDGLSIIQLDDAGGALPAVRVERLDLDHQ
mmetsp:Transcript_28285/g.85241  ORF Transcript_28285/g.85241 Transcript_28285/m.85241 type:complete len:719 (+) Transcript_28285:678-2834(+)